MIINGGVLKWLEKESDQHFYKSYFHGVVKPLYHTMNVPPFQLYRPHTDGQGAINLFKLINRETGTETVITSEIYLAGLSVEVFTGYDLIIYPSTMPIPGLLLEGTYYAYMRDVNGNEWESETFVMKRDVSRMVKIVFCHGEDFSLPTGHISYDNGYKNILYLKSQVGKPSYEYEEEIEKREGYNFPLSQLTYKQFKFETHLPEYIIDVARLIRLHDFVTIYDRGETYTVDEFILDSPNWLQQGHVARCNFEFRTDKVFTTYGRGVTSASCEIAAGGCFMLNYTAVAIVDDGSAEHTGYYYLDSGGNQVNFVEDDYLLVNNAGTITLWQYNGATYDSISTTDGNYIYEANGGNYYYDFYTGGINTNSLDSYTLNKAFGKAIGGTTVEIWVETVQGYEKLVATGDAAEFTDLGTGITFERPNGATRVKALFYNSVCGLIQTSDWLTFDLPCAVDVKGDYANDQAAITFGSLVTDDIYALDDPNSHGYPAGLLIKLQTSDGYESEAIALASIGYYNTCYSLSYTNQEGQPGGMMKVAIDPSNPLITYSSDSDAFLTGGLGVGDLYIWSGGLPYGLNGYYLKKLIDTGA